MPSQTEIFEKVSATLVDALNDGARGDQAELHAAGRPRWNRSISSTSSFVSNTSSASKSRRHELFPESIFQGDPISSGRQGPQKGLDEYAQKMPFADISKFEKNPELTAISDLFTVDAIAKVHRTQAQWQRYSRARICSRSPAWGTRCLSLVPQAPLGNATRALLARSRASWRAMPKRDLGHEVGLTCVGLD